MKCKNCGHNLKNKLTISDYRELLNGNWINDINLDTKYFTNFDFPKNVKIIQEKLCDNTDHVTIEFFYKE